MSQEESGRRSSEQKTPDRLSHEGSRFSAHDSTSQIATFRLDGPTIIRNPIFAEVNAGKLKVIFGLSCMFVILKLEYMQTRCPCLLC